jgi:predicted nuclease of predicted toxin-antitoxin system
VKLLLDECISPSLVQPLAERGIHAVAIRDLGRQGLRDDEVWRLALEMSAVVVTANEADFIRLASSGPLHAGLIILRSGELLAGEQLVWLNAALDALAERGETDPLNQAIIVDGPDLVEMRILPAS